MPPLRIGIIGLGNISGIYFKNLARFEETEVVAVADLDAERAKEVATREGIALVLSPEELIVSPEVDLVLNLTIPKAHAPIAMQAIAAGKHVYGEKPLAIDRASGRRLVELAKEKGVRVGSAPDTFLGAGIQTARSVIDEGLIGDPVGANAFMLCRGHESWHPSPEFYYERGGGPMLDMGPYYLTALVNLLGGVKRICGSARISFPTRTITSQPKSGKVVQVETPTHVVGVLEFAQGAIGQITTSFDVWGSTEPTIVIYGSEGTLLVPDPNGFGGDVKLSRRGGPFEVVEPRFGHGENERGIGVLDIALAIKNDRPHRANGELAAHVLDIMLGIEESAEGGNYIELNPVARPEPVSKTEFESGPEN